MKRIICTIAAGIAAFLWLIPAGMWFAENDMTRSVSCIAFSSLMAALAVLIYLDQPPRDTAVRNKKDEVNIDIKYFSEDIEKIDYIGGVDKSNWIDLRAAEEVTLRAGETKLIPLGVGMKLPEGYEAHIVPRSSTYKKFGIMQANHFGVIDNSYCGNNDQWMFPAHALRDTTIHINDRICQFRIEKNQPQIILSEVNNLSDKSRGGFGSTGEH